MRARAIPSVAMLVGLAVSLGACGANAPPGAGRAAATFAASANRTCAAFYAKAQALPPPVGRAQIETYTERQQALRDQELSALRRLTAPAAGRVGYAEFLAGLASVENLYAKAIVASKSPHAASVPVLVERAAKLEAMLRRIAHTLALGECARNPYSGTRQVNSEGTSGPS